MKPNVLVISVLLAIPSVATAQQQPATQQADTATTPSASDRMRELGGALLMSLFDKAMNHKKPTPAASIDATQSSDTTGGPAPATGVGTLMTEEPAADAGATPQEQTAATTARPRPTIKPRRRPLAIRTPS